jgi:hypothetical protein
LTTSLATKVQHIVIFTIKCQYDPYVVRSIDRLVTWIWISIDWLMQRADRPRYTNAGPDKTSPKHKGITNNLNSAKFCSYSDRNSAKFCSYSIRNYAKTRKPTRIIKRTWFPAPNTSKTLSIASPEIHTCCTESTPLACDPPKVPDLHSVCVLSSYCHGTAQEKKLKYRVQTLKYHPMFYWETKTYQPYLTVATLRRPGFLERMIHWEYDTWEFTVSAFKFYFLNYCTIYNSCIILWTTVWTI